MEQRLMSPPPAALNKNSPNEINHDSSMVPQFQHCIEACLLCFESCEQMIVHLNSQENIDPNLIRLLNDAIEITQVSATFMLRGSNFHIRTCAVCAEVTKICAEALEKTQAAVGEELLKSCLTALRECSESCYQMAHHH